MSVDDKKIVLWTDGSAVPNPGKGGYAVIHDGKPVRIGTEEKSTNNRMEGMALINAMEYANGRECEINTDSEFWVNVLTKWASGWEARGWKKSRGQIQNLDIVQKMYTLYKEGNVELKWTKAHVGTKFNEMADEWANKAREGFVLSEDDNIIG